jgi:hypothetical protein
MLPSLTVFFINNIATHKVQPAERCAQRSLTTNIARAAICRQQYAWKHPGEIESENATRKMEWVCALYK